MSVISYICDNIVSQHHQKYGNIELSQIENPESITKVIPVVDLNQKDIEIKRRATRQSKGFSITNTQQKVSKGSVRPHWHSLDLYIEFTCQFVNSVEIKEIREKRNGYIKGNLGSNYKMWLCLIPQKEENLATWWDICNFLKMITRYIYIGLHPNISEIKKSLTLRNWLKIATTATLEKEEEQKEQEEQEEIDLKERLSKLKIIGHCSVPSIFSQCDVEIFRGVREVFRNNMDLFLIMEKRKQTINGDNIDHLEYFLKNTTFHSVHFSVFFLLCIELIFNEDTRRTFFTTTPWIHSMKFEKNRIRDVKLFLLVIELAVEMYLGIDISRLLDGSEQSGESETKIISPRSILKAYHRECLTKNLEISTHEYFHSTIESDETFIQFVADTMTHQSISYSSLEKTKQVERYKSWILLNRNEDHPFDIKIMQGEKDALFLTHVEKEKKKE